VLAGNVKHQNIMIWWLLVLMAIVLLCSCLNPRHALRESAIRAIDASVMASRFDDDVWNRKARTPQRAEAGLSASPSKHVRDAAPLQRQGEVVPQTSAAPASRKRQRVTPFQAKLVAASQDWRCGCGCRDPEDAQGRGYQLDANFEIDHRVPTRWGGRHDKSNWVAVLRAHHAIKSARESSMSARRGC
jgi:hypothetical protein